MISFLFIPQTYIFLHFLICRSLSFNFFFRTLGLVFQSENFNFNRYSNHIMDPWSYIDSPVPEQNLSKPRLQPGDDLAALTMLYEQCKVDKDQLSIIKISDLCICMCLCVYICIHNNLLNIKQFVCLTNFRARKTRSLLHATV